MPHLTELAEVAAVLCDMDGTLVDSDAAVERAWRAWAGDNGINPETVLAIAHGVPGSVTVRRLLPGLSEAEVESHATRQLELESADLAEVVPTVGAHRFIDLLGRLGLPWAVVTSADRRLAAARLGHTGIAPPVLITFDDVPAGKPDPAGYLLAAARLGVPAGRCLVVEDTDVGVAAGQAAGALVAAVKGRMAALRPDTLDDLADWIAAAHGDTGR
ncbi:MAG TPA: HAD-IA family hydrolase [Pseudonocardia sp.]